MNTTIIDNFIIGVVNLFNDINSGNPACIGIGYSLGIVLSLILMYIIKTRTSLTMDRHLIISLGGSVLFTVRFFILLIFYWGYQIQIYTDQTLFMFMSPLEHFFYAIGLICFGYYSLNHYDYFPGLLKSFIWWIPAIITTTFIYDTIEYKNILSTFSNSPPFVSCNIDWQLHLILLICSLYILIVSILKFDRSNIYLTIFWSMMLISQYFKTIFGFYNLEPMFMTTIYNSVQIWSILTLMLHFISDLYQQCKKPYTI